METSKGETKAKREDSLKMLTKSSKKSASGITLIALVITIIVLLILAGVTIAALTGSDSAPAKANEAAQKNDIGTAKDDVQLTAVNALNEAYETAYVADGVSAGNASELVGKTVVKALYDKYGTSSPIGKATVSIEVTGSTNVSDLQAITGGTITIYTTDYELIGTVELSGGVINWGEIGINAPSILLTAEDSTTLAPSGTLQLGATFRKMDPIPLGNLTWTSNDTSVATVSTSGLVTVKSDAEDGKTANITATGNGVTSSPLTITVKDKKTVAKYKPKSSTEAVKPLTELMNKTGNITIEDKNGKNVVVPEGFEIAYDSGETIEEGIVIEDAFSTDAKKGSQFVWVPIDTTVTYSTGANGNDGYVGSAQQTSLATANSSFETAGATSGTIKLSRYDFGERADATSVSTLIPQGAQGEIKRRSSYYTEDKNGFTKNGRTYQASVARKDEDGEIEFISKANSAKGFYIGRYEMGKESSKDDTAVCKYDKTTYTNVYRGGVTGYSGALELAQNMYGYQSGKFASDLINSYAWDTAIAFIEKCRTESNSSNYAFQTRTRTDRIKRNTGYATNKDEQCKINDMAGNVFEWTTESSNDSGRPCVNRGGSYVDDAYYTSYRYDLSTSESSVDIGFRPILYIL